MQGKFVNHNKRYLRYNLRGSDAEVINKIIAPGNHKIVLLHGLEALNTQCLQDEKFLSLTNSEMELIGLNTQDPTSCFMSPENYKKNLGPELFRIKEQEDNIRQRLLVPDDLTAISDAENLMIDVFADFNSFINKVPNIDHIPKLFRVKKNYYDRELTPAPLITSQSEFLNRFDTMTNQILRGLNWSNVFVAGGIVLATLLGKFINYFLTVFHIIFFILLFYYYFIIFC